MVYMLTFGIIWGILMVNVTIYIYHTWILWVKLYYVLPNKRWQDPSHPPRIASHRRPRLGMQRGGLPRESIAALHELLDVDPVRAITWARIQWCSLAQKPWIEDEKHRWI